MSPTSGSGTGAPVTTVTGDGSVLSLKSRFFKFLGTYRALVATGGSTSKFTVASLADAAQNAYAEWQLRVFTGASIGDLRVLGAGPNSLGELEPKRVFSSTGPVSADTAELWGNSIDGGTDLTALFDDVLTVARPYVPTMLTIVTDQSIYDITAYVRDEADARRVTIRTLDPANITSYQDHSILHPRAVVAINASTGAREVKLDIGCTLTAQTPAVQELYLWSYKTLTAFVTDASTVEAEYADWLAWEAVLRHAVDLSTQTTADKAKWERLTIRASNQVQEARRQFMPYIPKYINPFEAGA